MANRFNFTGVLSLPKEGGKIPFVKNGKTNDDRASLRMSFGVKESQNNMAFVEAFDAQQGSIKTMSRDNEKISVDWEDRFDSDVVSNVANYRKYTVDLGEEHGGRKDFVTLYDAIEHLEEHLPDYKGKVTVTGQYTKEYYNGKYFDRFRLQNVYAVNEETKSCLSLTMEMFHNKDCVDVAEYAEAKKIFVNGYTPQYINATEGTKQMPHQFVFSAARYDEENDNHMKRLAYVRRFVEVKSKTYVRMLWEVVLLRGAEEAEFNESMLTDSQREQVELGFKSIDDFRPNGSIYGDRVNEFRLRLPILKGDYAEGLVDTEMKSTEFEETIYVPASAEEKMSDAKKSGKSKKKSTATKDDDKAPFDTDADDLF